VDMVSIWPSGNSAFGGCCDKTFVDMFKFEIHYVYHSLGRELNRHLKVGKGKTIRIQAIRAVGG
jgi:hypothetical protein